MRRHALHQRIANAPACNTSTWNRSVVAGELGFEPRLTESESALTAFHRCSYCIINGEILLILRP